MLVHRIIKSHLVFLLVIVSLRNVYSMKDRSTLKQCRSPLFCIILLSPSTHSVYTEIEGGCELVLCCWTWRRRMATTDKIQCRCNNSAHFFQSIATSRYCKGVYYISARGGEPRAAPHLFSIIEIYGLLLFTHTDVQDMRRHCGREEGKGQKKTWIHPLISL